MKLDGTSEYAPWFTSVCLGMGQYTAYTNLNSAFVLVPIQYSMVHHPELDGLGWYDKH